MTLYEAYAKRLAISESVFAKSHDGEKMDQNRKLVTAKCLENVNKFMNEAFESSQGTQRTDMGLFKKFALNLTTVALPNLIANDLVIVHPMSSMRGYINYIQYSFSTKKGDVQPDENGNMPMISNPWGFGDAHVDYTSRKVVEQFEGDGSTKEFTVMWNPVFVEKDKDGKYLALKVTVDGTAVADADITVDSESGKVTLATAPAEDAVVKVAYAYDNVIVPQANLPMVKAEMKSIALVAKARRIAIFYSQIAAYQAKTDYGVDLGDQLAEKAVGELSYEIDTEVVNMLAENAKSDAELVWSKTLPVGVSKRDHYEGFTEILAIASQKIYDATKKFAPNYMICASNLLPVLSMISAFKPANTGAINGPYMAGTINGLKVFVSPNVAVGDFIVGVNGSDAMSSAAVYAPYMAIVPTMLLQYADGGTTQGWSTLYDLKMLNENLLVKGHITD